MKSEQNWSDVEVWRASCIKNSGNAIPPVSHCLIINKMDGRLVTKLHQKSLHLATLAVTTCLFFLLKLIIFDQSKLAKARLYDSLRLIQQLW